MLGRLIWLGAGAAGGYLAYRRRRARKNAVATPLYDWRGEPLEPTPVELEGGARVPVVAAGEGEPLLLVSGLSGDKEVFRHQIPPFSKRYSVVATDLRDSFAGVEPEFDRFAHDLATILDAFGGEPANILGLSFGGPIAMRFAALYPERTAHLILTNTLARLDLSHVGFNKALLIPPARIATRHLPAFLVRRLGRFWGRLGVWVYDSSAGNSRIIDYELEPTTRVPSSEGTLRMSTFRHVDLRDDLRRIETPALVIAGAADSYTPNAWQKEIAELLPNATYVEIADAGHLALISNAERFNQIVLDWLASPAKSLAEPSAQ